MRVLLTNDDGIQAIGLGALRRALAAVSDIDLHVIAPNANRSATARSITTRSPLWVEEVSFDDGSIGYATDGTPVDCVRFAELGLIGDRPDLIVAGINHGSNLGDDVTYSGTVAAAFEGIVLGIPAVAVSQQSTEREMDFRLARHFDFSVAAALTTEIVAVIASDGLPEGTLINLNCPGTEPTGIEVTHLGKRLYNNELKQVETDGDSRRRYEIYGFEPSFKDEAGTDLAAIARGRVSVTAIHFDLTDRGGLEQLRRWDLDAMLAAGQSESAGTGS